MALAASIWRGLARSVMPKMFEQGYSANAALRLFRSMGYKRQRKGWLTDWREITGAKKLEKIYKYIPRKFALSYKLMAPTETFQTNEFKYIFDVIGKDAVTGEPAERTMSLGSENRYAPDEAEAIYSEIVVAEEDRYRAIYNFEPETVVLRVIYRRVHPS